MADAAEELKEETMTVEDLLDLARAELERGVPYSCPVECGMGPYKTEKGYKDHMEDKHGVTL